MSGPSQRAAERQAARRSGSTRPAGPTMVRRSTAPTARRPASAPTTASTKSRKRSLSGAAAAVRDRPSLTGRAVILAGVVALLVFTLAVPTRELLHQRAEINALRSDNAATQSRVDELTVRQERLQDPAYVTSLIRERLHYVLPGEVGYVVLDPSEAPAPSTATASSSGNPWYSALWTSVQTVDHAGAPAGPAPIVVRPNAPR
jgi:cell division protein FtsB